MSRILVTGIVLFRILPADGAELSPICPDRPGKGTSSCTLDAGHMQFELGLFDESFQHSSGFSMDAGSVGAWLVKYGVSDRTDVEAAFTLYQFQNIAAAGEAAEARGVGDFFLRAKYNPLSTGSPFSLALDPYIKAPMGPLSNGAVEGGLAIPMAYDLGGNWSLAMTPEADVLLDASGQGHHGNLIDVVGVGRSFGPLTLSAEVWTSQNLEPAGTVSQYSADIAAAWLTDVNTQLDLGANFGLNRATPGVEVYAGLSRRF